MTNVNGTFFIVNLLTSKDGKQYAFAMSPSMPSTYGHMPAIPVTLEGADASDLPKTGTKLSGINKDMSIAFASSSNQCHTLKLLGPYAEMEQDYYLHGRLYTYYSLNLMYIYPARGSGPFTIALNDRTVNETHRVSFTYKGPKAGNDTNHYYHYIGLNTNDPTDPNIKYFTTTNPTGYVNNDGTMSKDYESFPNYCARTDTPSMEQVNSYLFRLLPDRVDTFNLRETLVSMESVLTWNDRYDPKAYGQLCTRSVRPLSCIIPITVSLFVLLTSLMHRQQIRLFEIC